ncbi:diguanylate cyclase domain-containing protein [Kineococcus rhizosphaerae]|uniref:GGDEF domain-containing protein n=1 Tax=Kineococcus rhizosphaerae TaxID=559628 RepID=A0A2T0R7R3_9ACTN|nr:diguanylate cyclase [Kineococcus rhizosphaerae]PRY17207.1 GGDEF domain-containing protein [Kineococcus rhizosphaerae]
MSPPGPDAPGPAVPVVHPQRASSASGGRGLGAALLLVPALGAVAVTLAAVLASSTTALVVALAAAGVLVVVLAVALAGSVRAHRQAERSADQLLSALETARDENVNDAVTGLLNRRGLLLVGHQVLESARRSGGAVHACVVEVTPGVRLGEGARTADDVRLQREAEWAAAAAALRGATRTSDVVAREGEGRFIVLGPGAGLHAQELERRIRVGLAQGRLAGGGDRTARLAVEVGASVLAPWDEGGVADLLVRAEQALAQRRALRRSAPQHGWGRRRSDRSARPEQRP